jgi:cob(I)alamin adenosyltransferase
MARAFCGDSDIANDILQIQKELVILMGEIAVLREDRVLYVEKGFKLVTSDMVDRLTARVEDLEKNHQIRYTHWATPGSSQASACLDLARTACRRAERAVVAIREAGHPVTEPVALFLNRLSDLLWLYARWVETKAGLA